MFISNFAASILQGALRLPALLGCKIANYFNFCCNYLPCSHLHLLPLQPQLPIPVAVYSLHSTVCSLRSAVCSLPAHSCSRRKGFNFISMPLPQVRVSVCLCLPAAGIHTAWGGRLPVGRGRGRAARCRCLRYLRNSIRKATRRKQMEAMARLAS